MVICHGFLHCLQKVCFVLLNIIVIRYAISEQNIKIYWPHTMFSKISNIDPNVLSLVNNSSSMATMYMHMVNASWRKRNVPFQQQQQQQKEHTYIIMPDSEKQLINYQTLRPCGFPPGEYIQTNRETHRHMEFAKP